MGIGQWVWAFGFRVLCFGLGEQHLGFRLGVRGLGYYDGFENLY